MATRNSAKMSAEIRRYLDDAIKNLVTKSNIDSLKAAARVENNEVFKKS